jgi:hypothetical protein
MLCRDFVYFVHERGPSRCVARIIVTQRAVCACGCPQSKATRCRFRTAEATSGEEEGQMVMFILDIRTTAHRDKQADLFCDIEHGFKVARTIFEIKSIVVRCIERPVAGSG